MVLFKFPLKNDDYSAAFHKRISLASHFIYLNNHLFQNVIYFFQIINYLNKTNVLVSI